ncbi:MAG: 2-amino-4-hydroxy-6-hydroxymethyldihydropteridine diphosphokinase [Verrucomicrobiota bacterium]
MTTANTAIGLGSNLGNSVSAIKEAEERLEKGGFKIISRSSFYRTKPVDCEPGTPSFINAAVIGLWKKEIPELWQLCKNIEQTMGRPVNHSSRQARIIDIDILIVGDAPYSDENLTIPHPQLTDRLFVLKPLAEIAPEWCIPPTNQRIDDAYKSLLSQT